MEKWRKYNGALIPLTPPHIKIKESIKEIKLMVKKSKVYFARWSSDFDCKQETAFWYVICDQSLTLNDYSINTRSKITRGLKHCNVKRINKKELKNNGYDTYKKAFKRYNTFQKLNTEDQFKDSISLLGDNWDLWGVYFKNRLVGYSQNRLVDKSCDYSIIKFHPDFLRYYSSYALFYSMNNYYLNNLQYKYVNDGARSISHDTDIQEFLIRKFKFRKAYCQLHLIYSKKMLILLSLLYPFRDIFLKFNYSFFIKVNTLLRQEIIRRVYVHSWRIYNGAVIPLTPPHIKIKESIKEIKLMIKKSKVYFARWTSDFDCKEETEFWYVICDQFIPFEMLGRNTKHNVKRGLSRCRIEQVDNQFVVENCYSVYKSAFDNYRGHLSPISEHEFKKEYTLNNDSGVWHFWVVYENESNKIIAYSRNRVEYNICELCTTMFHPKFLRKNYPSEALFYTMNQYYLNERNFRYVNDGARSISHETNIQSFLIQKFKFRKAYCKLNIIYSPKIKFFLSIIYHFRSIISLLRFGPFIKINILIHQEFIRRSYD